jgi:hypothetical protein
MLGLFDLLPFLDGWNYRVYTIPLTPIVYGEAPKTVLTITRKGWHLSTLMTSNDAFGTLVATLKSPGGIEYSPAYNAEYGLAVGAVQQDPSGWVQMYFRPNPLSTFGVYVGRLDSPGYQGSLFPTGQEIRIQVYLDAGSTQSVALVGAQILNLEIKDEPAFRKSLRDFLKDVFGSTIRDAIKDAVQPSQLMK